MILSLMMTMTMMRSMIMLQSIYRRKSILCQRARWPDQHKKLQLRIFLFTTLFPFSWYIQTLTVFQTSCFEKGSADETLAVSKVRPDISFVFEFQIRDMIINLILTSRKGPYLPLFDFIEKYDWKFLPSQNFSILCNNDFAPKCQTI